MLWEGNIDIQFIRESSLVLDRYITSYITKGERQATKEIWQSCSENRNLRSSLKSYALKSFKNRECGIFEVADKLLGYGLCEFSDVVKYLPALPWNERNRALKNIKLIKDMKDDDTNIYHNNMIDTYYPNRPDMLENMCLHTLISWFEYTKKITCKKESKVFTLKNNLGYLQKREKPKVIKLPSIVPKDNDSLERYCYQMILIFVPWRDEKKLKADNQSYQEALQQASSDKLLQEELYSNFQLKKKKVNDALNYIKKIRELETENIEEDKAELLDTNDYDLGVAEYSNEKIDSLLLDSKMKNLNSEQLEVFNYVSGIIEEQENFLPTCIGDLPGSKGKTKNVRIFCSGVAG